MSYGGDVKSVLPDILNSSIFVRLIIDSGKDLSLLFSRFRIFRLVNSPISSGSDSIRLSLRFNFTRFFRYPVSWGIFVILFSFASKVSRLTRFPVSFGNEFNKFPDRESQVRLVSPSICEGKDSISVYTEGSGNRAC